MTKQNDSLFLATPPKVKQELPKQDNNSKPIKQEFSSKETYLKNKVYNQNFLIASFLVPLLLGYLATRFELDIIANFICLPIILYFLYSITRNLRFYIFDLCEITYSHIVLKKENGYIFKKIALRSSSFILLSIYIIITILNLDIIKNLFV